MSRIAMSTLLSRRFLWRVSKDPATLQWTGGSYGGDLGSALASRSIHWLLGIALSLSLTGSAHALPPLMVAADTVRQDLEGFWKEGDFVVGVPSDPGRPGLRPLRGHSPIQLSSDMHDWTPIGKKCQDNPRSVGRFGGAPVEAIVTGDSMHPKVQLWMDGRPVAEALLGRPAEVCSLNIANADNIPGPELIAAWRINAPNPLIGFTVYRIPESLDPTPIRSPK